MKKFLLALILSFFICGSLASAEVLPDSRTEMADSALKDVMNEIISRLGLDDEVDFSVSCDLTGKDILDAVVTVDHNQGSRSFHVMMILPEDVRRSQIYQSAMRQLENDVPLFLSMGSEYPMIDYASDTMISSSSLDAGYQAGTCFKAGKDGILLARRSWDSVTVLDRFFSSGVSVAQKLEKRPLLSSLSFFGGMHSAGIGIQLRVPYLYPLSIVADCSYCYSSRIAFEAGMAMELPFSSIFSSDFPLIANARLIVLVEAGGIVALSGQLGYCVSAGVYYDHAVSSGFSWRIGYERRHEVISSLIMQNDFFGSFVWNI